MIKCFITILLLSIVTYCHAQNCKNVKPGMTSSEVLKVAGMPDSTKITGIDNGTDTIAVWYYGSQEALLSGGKVSKVIVDPKRENERSKQVLEGTLNSDDFERQMEELNQNSCK